MKTHGLTGVTLCVKNLYGCIPGALKQGYHKVLPNPRAFSRFLVRLHSEIAPRLNIVDGIVGLEGEGPGASGHPIPAGLILAGASACAVDIVASEMMGFRPYDIPTNRYSGIRRAEIETVGSGRDDQISFRKPLSANFPYLRHFERLLPRSRISFDPERCVRCGLCREKCPAGAIAFNPGPGCNHERCIHCYCCMEVCPHSAVYLREHWLRRGLRRVAKIAAGRR
jgi:ferredoxin